MRRGFLAGGAAILVAAALAVPLWLAVDDDGGRRAGALGASANAFSAELAIDGVAGGPFPVKSFSWEAQVVDGKPNLGDFEIVRGADSKSSQWFGFAVGAQPAKTPATLELKRLNGTSGLMETFLTYRLTNAAVRSYRSADDDTTGATDPPFDTIGLRYSAIEHLLAKGTAAVAAPGSAHMRMTVSTASSTPVEIQRYKFGFAHPPAAKPLVDRLLVQHRLDDGLARWFAERATTGITPAGTKVTIDLRRTDQQTGAVETYLTYELENALVGSVRDVGVGGGPPFQEVEFAFETLKATSPDGYCQALPAPC